MVKPNGEDKRRILFCVLCTRRIYPEREGAPANADVKAHAKCCERS